MINISYKKYFKIPLFFNCLFLKFQTKHPIKNYLYNILRRDQWYVQIHFENGFS